MTDRDDGDSDDPQLQSLRAVWLAMPDEDPPQRGLAELMAAARVKAEQMATPSLWQRISALLRRPPVLAFATVLVLIGGGVLIGRRGDKMQVAPEVDQDRSRAPVQTATLPTAPALGSSAGEEDEEARPEMAEPMIPEPTFEPEKKEAPAVTHRPAPPKKADLVAGNKAADKAEAADSAVSGTIVRRDEKPAAKPSAAKPSAVKPAAEKQFAERPPAASDDFAAPAPSEIADESVSSATTTRGAGVPKGAAEQTATQPAPSRTAQVLAQAKAAIARGDCATARALLKRVASDDANAYRKALASDASLKSCVTAAQ